MDNEEFRYYIDNATDAWGETLDNQFWVFDGSYGRGVKAIAKCYSYDNAIIVRDALERKEN